MAVSAVFGLSKPWINFNEKSISEYLFVKVMGLSVIDLKGISTVSDTEDNFDCNATVVLSNEKNPRIDYNWTIENNRYYM